MITIAEGMPSTRFPPTSCARMASVSIERVASGRTSKLCFRKTTTCLPVNEGRLHHVKIRDRLLQISLAPSAGRPDRRSAPGPHACQQGAGGKSRRDQEAWIDRRDGG